MQQAAQAVRFPLREFSLLTFNLSQTVVCDIAMIYARQSLDWFLSILACLHPTDLLVQRGPALEKGNLYYIADFYSITQCGSKKEEGRAFKAQAWRFNPTRKRLPEFSSLGEPSLVADLVAGLYRKKKSSGAKATPRKASPARAERTVQNVSRK
jgi:hypothetical protein